MYFFSNLDNNKNAEFTENAVFATAYRIHPQVELRIILNVNECFCSISFKKIAELFELSLKFLKNVEVISSN